MRVLERSRESIVSMLARLRRTEGAEIIEFAVSLPLLAVFVVGIYDFGTAFTLKHKLNTAVVEALRLASSRPGIGLSGSGACGGPVAVCLVRDVVTSSLTAGRVNTCGLGTATPSGPSPSLTWTYTVTCPNSRQLQLKIERGVVYQAAMPASFSNDAYQIEATRVTLEYPYQWQFSRAAGLLSGGSLAQSDITVVGMMQNVD